MALSDLEIEHVESVPETFQVHALAYTFDPFDLDEWHAGFSTEPDFEDAKEPPDWKLLEDALSVPKGTTSDGVQYIEAIDLMQFEHPEQAFMRCWEDGRVAVGRFPPLGRGEETFWFGVIKIVQGNIKDLDPDDESPRWRDLEVKKWFMTRGRRSEERREAFARRVWDALAERTDAFDGAEDWTTPEMLFRSH